MVQILLVSDEFEVLEQRLRLRVSKYTMHCLGVICMSMSCFGVVAKSAVMSSIPRPPQFEMIIAQIQKDVDAHVGQQVSQQRALIHHQAVHIVLKICEALQQLEIGDPAAAQQQLNGALEKLNELIEKHPTLQSVPVMVVNVVNDQLTNYDVIQHRKEEIDKQWQLGRIQQVRRLLKGYVSDISIKSLNMPVEVFVQGIQGINQLLTQNQVEKAKHVIEVLLESILVANYTIPLPLYRAELMITKAEGLTRQVSNNQKVDVAQLHLLLSNAKYQLKLAETLGYGTPKRYTMFYQAIDGIKSLVNANQQTTNLFSKLRFAIFNLKNRVIDLK